MPGSGELPAQQPAAIIGREAGLARLHALVDPPPRASQVLVVTGEAGMGKTVLLAAAADRGRLAGMRVLWVTGRESESKLAFAGLHQLLRPVLPVAADLPGRQAQALLGALGLSADPGAPDPLLTGVAVRTRRPRVEDQPLPRPARTARAVIRRHPHPRLNGPRLCACETISDPCVWRMGEGDHREWSSPSGGMALC